jgi:hypothetical protein
MKGAKIIFILLRRKESLHTDVKAESSGTH